MGLMFCFYFCSSSSLFAWFQHFSVFMFPVALPFFWIQQWVMYLCPSAQSVSHCSFHTKHYLSFITRSYMGKSWDELTSGKSSLLDTENASDLCFHLLCILFFFLSEVLYCAVFVTVFQGVYLAQHVLLFSWSFLFGLSCTCWKTLSFCLSLKTETLQMKNKTNQTNPMPICNTSWL